MGGQEKRERMRINASKKEQLVEALGFYSR